MMSSAGCGPDGDLREEGDELALEVAAGESPVASDVQVTDEVVGRRHRRCAQGEARGYPRTRDAQKSARGRDDSLAAPSALLFG